MPAKYQYIFNNTTEGLVTLKDEPLNWESLVLTFKRSKVFEGVAKNFSQDLVFWGEGNDYLRAVYANEGINSQVEVTVNIFDLTSFTYEELFLGRVNFTNYTEELTDDGLKTVNTNIEASLFEQQVEKGSGIDVDVFKLQDRFGEAITPFTNYEQVTPALSGQLVKDSFTSLENPTPQIEFFNLADYSNADIKQIFYLTFSLQDDLTSKLNINIPTTFIGQSLPNTLWTVFARGEATIDIDLTFRLKQTLIGGATYNGDGFIQLFIISPVFGQFAVDSILLPLDGLTSFDEVITLSAVVNNIFQAGEELRVYVKYDQTTDGSTVQYSEFDFNTTNYEFNITQDSSFRDTLPRGMFPFELFSRVVNHLTGKANRVVGDIISRTNQDFNPQGADGIASKVMTASGLGLRNFPANESPLVVKLKDLYATYNYGFNIGLGFINFGGEETVLIDAIDKFYTDTVIFTLTSLKNPRLSVDSASYWSSLTFGFTKYKIEDRNFQSTQEFNTQRIYNSSVEVIDTSKKILSPYIGAGYGIEYQRRDQWFASTQNDQKPDGKRFDDDKFVLAITENEAGTLESIARINEAGAVVDWIVSTFTTFNTISFNDPNFIEVQNDILTTNGEVAYVQTDFETETSPDNGSFVFLMGGKLFAYPDPISYGYTVNAVCSGMSLNSGFTSVDSVVFELIKVLNGTPSTVDSSPVYNPNANFFGTPFDLTHTDTNQVSGEVYYQLRMTVVAPALSLYHFAIIASFINFEMTTSTQFHEYRQENAKEYFGSGVTVSNLANSATSLNFRITPRQSIERHLGTLGAVNFRLSPNQLTFSGDPIGNVLVSTTNPDFAENDDINTGRGSLYINEYIEFETEWTLSQSNLVDQNRYGVIVLNTDEIQFTGFIEEINHTVEKNIATVKLRRKGSFIPAPAVLDPPTITTVTAGQANPMSELLVSWTSNSAGLEDGFNIYRSLDPVSSFSFVGTVGTNVLSYLDTGLDSGVVYYYRVTSFDQTQESINSNTVSGTTLADVLYSHDFSTGLGNYTINPVYAANVTLIAEGILVNANIIDTILTSTDSVAGTLTGNYKVAFTIDEQDSDGLTRSILSGNGYIFGATLPKSKFPLITDSNTVPISVDTVTNIQIDVETSTSDTLIITKVEFIEI